MTTPIAFGWNVKLGVNGRGNTGKMVYLASSIWTRTDVPGYPGFAYTAASETANKAFLDDVLAFLVGGGSKDILILELDDSYMFGTDFASYLTGLGHSITRSGAANSFTTYQPWDFDLVMMSGCSGTASAGAPHYSAYNSAILDDYLLNRAGHVLGVADLNIYEQRYGIGGWNVPHNYRQSGTSPPGPDYLSRPFGAGAIGAGPYQITAYSSYAFDDTLEPTVGGVTHFEDNDLGETVLAIWSEDGT